MSWILLFSLSEWIIRLVMLPVVTSRRRPNTAMAWLLLIFFIPWAGLVLFLIIGTRRFPRSRRLQLRHTVSQIEKATERFADDPNIVHPQLNPQLDSTVRMAEQLGLLPILGGNKIEFLADTQQAIDRLIADIDSAKHHAHLLFYIFSDDATGRSVMDALGRASERGVTCRLLVDSVGSWKSLRSLTALATERGVELHEMLPVSIYHRVRRRMARIDLRNHRKLAVIDGQIGYAGSQNIVDANYGHKDMAWIDLMARMTGPICLELQTIFIVDWNQESNELLTGPDILVSPTLVGDTPVQTLPSGPSFPVQNYQRLVVSAIHAAQRRVIITTPYLVPDEPLLQAMQVAVLRGVDVDVIVPRKGDQIIVAAAARAYYQDILDAGVHLYLHGQGLLHSKTMTVDDSIALLGSSNFDIRSFAINFELNMLLYGPEVTQRLRGLQLHYMAQSERLDARQWRRRPRSRQIVDNMARLMSPLL